MTTEIVPWRKFQGYAHLKRYKETAMGHIATTINQLERAAALHPRRAAAGLRAHQALRRRGCARGHTRAL